MSEHDPNNGPDEAAPEDPTTQQVPGWPSPSGPPPASPTDPTMPVAPAPAGPPPGAGSYGSVPPGYTPPSSYPPPNVPPAPGGYAPPANVPPGPGGYGPPNVPPAPGAYGPPGAPGAAPGYGYPYAGQGYGGYPVQREHPEGTTILILGICSWVICGLAAPFAWIKGNAALKEIDRNPMAYSNRGNVQAGRILGMIYSILVLIGLALFAVLIVIGMASGSSTS